jgi:DNA-binding transcriptional regulator YiaG
MSTTSQKKTERPVSTGNRRKASQKRMPRQHILERVESARSGKTLRLRQRLSMTREVFGRLTATSVRTLATVEAGHAPSESFRRRLTEVERITNALSEIVQEDAVGPWLQTPNKAFDNAKPMELIERGEIDRIWQMIHSLRSGVS